MLTSSDEYVLWRIAYGVGLYMRYSKHDFTWWLLARDSGQLKGRIPDTMTYKAALATIGNVANEMGSLYALADEARFAKAGGGV